MCHRKHFHHSQRAPEGGLKPTPHRRGESLRQRGFSLLELLTVMAIISLLVGLLLPALVQAKRTARRLKDATQIRGIHQSWLTFAASAQGTLPTPGLIDRQPVNGVDIPGKGNEDKKQNDTARLHSLSIMQHYYPPKMCVGPTEPSGKVAVKDDYNYEVYNVVNDVYWDDDCQASFNTSSFLSYASMPIAGERQRQQWRNTMDAKWPILGTRGVRDGKINANDYNKSITLQIHGDGRCWIGNLCYHDNHSELIETFFPNGVNWLNAGVSEPDNIFKNDGGGPTNVGGRDAWLVIVSKGGLLGTPDTIAGALCQWD